MLKRATDASSQEDCVVVVVVVVVVAVVGPTESMTRLLAFARSPLFRISRAFRNVSEVCSRRDLSSLLLFHLFSSFWLSSLFSCSSFFLHGCFRCCSGDLESEPGTVSGFRLIQLIDRFTRTLNSFPPSCVFGNFCEKQVWQKYEHSDE